MESITVTPSYGRDYKTAAEVLRDWEAGKDFTMSNGLTQINKQDAKGMRISFRFDKKRKQHVLIVI